MRRQFSNPFLNGLEFLNEAEKEKTRKDSPSALSRFTSLSEGEMEQILTERHSGKTKQKINDKLVTVATFTGFSF